MNANMAESPMKMCIICKVRIGQERPEFDLNPIICDQCTTRMHGSSINDDLIENKTELFDDDVNCIKEELDVENKEECDDWKDEILLVNMDIPSRVNMSLVCTYFFCHDCGVLLDSKDSLIQHIVTHHKKKESEGTQCDSTSHTDSQVYKCQYCSFSTGNNSELKAHVICIHDKRELDKSNNNKSPKEKEMKCSECNCKFYHKSASKVHLCKRLGEKFLKCDKCDYRCTLHTDLRRHVWSHRKPYRCNKCDYGCRSLSELHVHRRKHTAEGEVQPHVYK